MLWRIFQPKCEYSPYCFAFGARIRALRMDDFGDGYLIYWDYCPAHVRDLIHDLEAIPGMRADEDLFLLYVRARMQEVEWNEYKRSKFLIQKSIFASKSGPVGAPIPAHQPANKTPPTGFDLGATGIL
jgi:hypothetical protein